MAAFSLAALASELTNDPVSMGYAALKANANDQGIADKLNALTAPGAASVFRNDIKAVEIVNAIVAADFAGLNVTQLAKIQLMTQAGVLDATSSNTRTIFLGIFAGLTNTITALTALASRTGSRAEALWGTGTVITALQVGAAR